MLAVDIQSFGDLRRGDDVQCFLRAAMYNVLVQAFCDSGLSWPTCHHEDRGDGVLAVAPPGAPATAFLDPLVDHVRAGLRRHNRFCNDLARISLRMSVHAGQVYFDENGVSGHAVTRLFRMLDADSVKGALAESGCDFALVTSEVLYEDVISQAPGLIDPGMYAPIDIGCKETAARAWFYLPPVRNPFVVSVSGQEPRERVPGGLRLAGAGTRRKAHPSASPRAGGLTIPLPRAPSAAAGAAAAGAAAPTAAAGPAGAAAQDTPAKDSGSVTARARLIASKAATMPGWLAGIPSNTSWQPRFRGRAHPGQRVQHV